MSNFLENQSFTSYVGLHDYMLVIYLEDNDLLLFKYGKITKKKEKEKNKESRKIRVKLLHQ